jgi:branched-chain amino acid transport system permease protein
MAFLASRLTPHASRLLSPLLIGGWFGLLSFPFMGVEGAAQVALAVAAGSLLWILGTQWAPARTFFRTFTTFLQARGEALAGRWKRLPVAVWTTPVVGALLILPFGLDAYALDVTTLAALYIVLALGLNLVVGQTGLLHLGYVAFYALGAYTYALLSIHFQVSFWLGLLMGASTAAAFGFILGLPVLRLRGDYLAIVTLGFGEITRLVLNNWDSLTRGPNGLLGIGRPALGEFVFRDPMALYYLFLALGLFTIFVMARLQHSRIGRAWIAIREDELAAETAGVPVVRLKLLAFTLGAAWAGLAGVFFAAKITFITPESFTFMESVIILCMVVLGGMGSIPGVVLGAVILVLLPEALREVQLYRMLLFGALMTAMMVFRPQGFLPSPRRRLELGQRRSAGAQG